MSATDASSLRRVSYFGILAQERGGSNSAAEMIPKSLSDCIPGVLSKAQLSELCKENLIQSPPDRTTIDYSSIDLTLSKDGYLMTKGSVKPFGESYEAFIKSASDFRKTLKPDRDDSFILEKKHTYVFRLEQQLGREIDDHEIYGQATAKSSVGRVDVLARLIVDGMDAYESFDPQGVRKGNGHLYVEVTPITFDVRVKPGIALSQLRLFYGHPDGAEMRTKELYRSVLRGGKRDGCLRVNLDAARIGRDSGCAFSASPTSKPQPVRLWKQDPRPNPRDYWKLEPAVVIKQKNHLQITKEQFYLLRSKEKVALPGGIAVYCRAIDETIGEMRIHYAGFVHPFFGRDRRDRKVGTPLIFEVRGHDVDVLLGASEKMARLIFYRMSKDCTEMVPSDYSDQTLQLSSFFGEWN
jgi:dCTP deaminase